MTPPEHFLIGVVSANIFYSSMHFSKGHEKKSHGYLKLAIAMGLAASMPDIDTFFGNYTSRDPLIGHRGWTHSFIGVLGISLAMTIIISILTFLLRIFTSYFRLLYNKFKPATENESSYNFSRDLFQPFLLKPFILLLLFLFFAGVTHLIADLPQAGSVWGGIPLLFPFKLGGEHVRFGGFGIIGWYDLKILWYLIGAVAITTPFVYFGKILYLIKKKPAKIAAVFIYAMVFLFSAVFFGWMIKHVKNSNYKNDKQWYVYQMNQVEKLPAFIKYPTLKGIKIFTSIFYQARNFNLNP